MLDAEGEGTGSSDEQSIFSNVYNSLGVNVHKSSLIFNSNVCRSIRYQDYHLET